VAAGRIYSAVVARPESEWAAVLKVTAVPVVVLEHWLEEWRGADV